MGVARYYRPLLVSIKTLERRIMLNLGPLKIKVDDKTFDFLKKIASQIKEDERVIIELDKGVKLIIYRYVDPDEKEKND